MKRRLTTSLFVLAALLLAACAGGTQTCVINVGAANTQHFWAYQDTDGNTVQGMRESDASGNITVEGVPDTVNCGSVDYRQISPEYGAV